MLARGETRVGIETNRPAVDDVLRKNIETVRSWGKIWDESGHLQEKLRQLDPEKATTAREVLAEFNHLQKVIILSLNDIKIKLSEKRGVNYFDAYNISRAIEDNKNVIFKNRHDEDVTQDYLELITPEISALHHAQAQVSAVVSKVSKILGITVPLRELEVYSKGELHLHNLQAKVGRFETLTPARLDKFLEQYTRRETQAEKDKKRLHKTKPSEGYVHENEDPKMPKKYKKHQAEIDPNEWQYSVGNSAENQSLFHPAAYRALNKRILRWGELAAEPNSVEQRLAVAEQINQLFYQLGRPAEAGPVTTEELEYYLEVARREKINATPPPSTNHPDKDISARRPVAIKHMAPTKEVDAHHPDDVDTGLIDLPSKEPTRVQVARKRHSDQTIDHKHEDTWREHKRAKDKGAVSADLAERHKESALLHDFLAESCHLSGAEENAWRRAHNLMLWGGVGIEEREADGAGLSAQAKIEQGLKEYPRWNKNINFWQKILKMSVSKY